MSAPERDWTRDLALEFVERGWKKARPSKTMEELNRELACSSYPKDDEVLYWTDRLLPWFRRGGIRNPDQLTQLQKVAVWLRRYGYISRKETIFTRENGMPYLQLPAIIWRLKDEYKMAIESQRIQIRPGVASCVYVYLHYDPMGVYAWRKEKREIERAHQAQLEL